MERCFSLEYPSDSILPELRPVYDEFLHLTAERCLSAMDLNRIKRCILAKEPVNASVRYIAGRGDNTGDPIFLIGRPLDKCYCIAHTYAVNNIVAFILVDNNNDMVIPDDLSDVFLGSLLDSMRFRKSRSSRVFKKVLNGVMVRDILDEDVRKTRFRRVRKLLDGE